MAHENLGPAEHIITTLTAYTDHLFHGRPGYVTPDARFNTGVRWTYVVVRSQKPAGAAEGSEKERVVFATNKVGKKTTLTRVGVLQPNNQIKEGGRVVGEYRNAGIFPEVAVWMYRQIAEVWKLDNEFAAKWASYSYEQTHRDLKVLLAAFMLCQSRKGDEVMDAGKVAFFDEDYRNVGEAMALLNKQGCKMDAKQIDRIYEVLSDPGVLAINRELGFAKSARSKFYGRWPRVVAKWLRHLENNPNLLKEEVRKGFKGTIRRLAIRSGYRPATPKFFEALRWRQAQAKDGRRKLLDINVALPEVQAWAGLTEEAICQKIVAERPSYKRLIALVPKEIGITRAILAATIEAKLLSDKDLVIATPTLEELGLLEVQEIRERWERAIKAAEDQRAANIASRVKSKVVEEKLQEAADIAVQKAVEEVVRGLRVYFMVDISGSMEGSIEAAKSYIAKFLQGFPPEQIHVAVFNTVGREVRIAHASAAGVQNAFKGIRAGGGTSHGSGVKVLQGYKPKDDEDVLFIFVGDEEDRRFTDAVRASGLNPVAFGFVKVRETPNDAVRGTATELGIPCFMIEEATFADPYAIPRTIRALVAATPVQKAVIRQATPRVSLVDIILKTPLLSPPAWVTAA